MHTDKLPSVRRVMKFPIFLYKFPMNPYWIFQINKSIHKSTFFSSYKYPRENAEIVIYDAQWITK